MSKNVKQAIDVLSKASKESCELLETDPLLKIQVKSVMDRMTGILCHAAGVSIDTIVEGVVDKEEPKRLTHVFGREIKARNTVNAVAASTPSLDEKTSFQSEVDEAFDMFLSLPASDLKEIYSDNVIRGVASKAGLTPSTQEAVTVPYITKVIDAVKNKAEQIAQDEVATNSVNTEKEPQEVTEVTKTEAAAATEANAQGTEQISQDEVVKTPAAQQAPAATTTAKNESKKK